MGARRINQPSVETHSKGWLGTSPWKTALFALLLIAGGLSFSHLFAPGTLPFRTIQVYGQLQWTNKDTLNQQVVEHINGGFFSLDVDSLKQRLEQLTWVESVAIRRVWPDVLQIEVSEQQPVAIWNQHAIINRRGELFTANLEKFPPGLVNIQGPRGTHRTLMSHYRALAEMTQAVGLRISSLKVNERRAMQLTLDNGLQLLLGRVRSEYDMETELNRFVQAYQATLASKIEKIQLVDLRYTNGLAVRWKQSANAVVDNKNSALNAG